MTHSAPSHLLPVFARVELGFERGEGAWLIATNGERYLDFTSGVAVNALGHAIRIWSQPCRSRPPSSGTCRTCSGARTATGLRHGCANRALPISCSSVIPAPRRWNARSRSRAAITPSKGHPERYRLVTFEGAFHGRTLGTLAATGSAKYLEGFGPPLDGFDQVRAWRSRSGQEGDRAEHRRHPDRAGAGRGRRALGAACVLQGVARAVRRQGPAADFRRGADRHGPHRRSVRL